MDITCFCNMKWEEFSMKKPNILLIMTDDHAAHAMSCYGSKINNTPNMDRIANEGMKFDNCFCTNSICAPSRATILTGKHSNKNGVRTLRDSFDSSQETFPKLLKENGYSTAIIGKWHLGHKKENLPKGFDYWNIFPGQGDYYDPVMKEMGVNKEFKGYATDIVTNKSLEWLEHIDKDKPFCLLCYHKAPHRPWLPDDKHKDMYKNIDIPIPETFNDNYENRSNAAKNAYMRIAEHMNSMDLKIKPPKDIKETGSLPAEMENNRGSMDDSLIRLNMPDSIEGYSLITNEGEVVEFQSKHELEKWKYQRFIKDYLRCVASVDDNIGKLLDYLDEKSLGKDTIVIYTSDQGFFLGDHGWFDKRFMYEESLRMPLLVRYPQKVQPGSASKKIVTNLDFAETILDYASVKIPHDMQGKSFRSILEGEEPENWQKAMYYRYWMHMAQHNVPAHYGIRTDRYKLIYYYGKGLGTKGSLDVHTEPEWELFDLEKDPYEMNNVYNDVSYKTIVEELKNDLYRLKNDAGDFE